jgi:membrane associated rhomboid family serine protease
VIPLRDVIPTRTYPVVTVLLVALNGLVLLCQLTLGADEWLRVLRQFGLTTAATDWRMPVASLVVHAGWVHAVANLLVLWLFGENVEDRMGHGRFLAFYVLCGLIALYAHMTMGPRGLVPAVGSSGAVAGVLGAYFRLYRRSRILILVPLPGNLQVTEVPAILFLASWAVVHLLPAAGASEPGGHAGAGTSLAPMALLVAFASGALLGRLLRRPERLRVEWWDERPRSRPRADRA